MRSRTGHIIALVGALLGWFALALQLVLLIGNIGRQGGTALQATWRFFGYFTILTNIAVAVVLTHATLRPESSDGPGNPRVRLSVATAIAMVGIVYSIALRELWSPQGWQKVADIALHDVTPVVFLLFFFFCGCGGLRWRDAAYALILPVIYLVYAFTRGTMDGWYAYHFLDPTKLNVGELTLNVVGLLFATWVVAMMIVGLTKLAWRRSRAPVSSQQAHT